MKRKPHYRAKERRPELFCACPIWNSEDRSVEQSHEL